jgi:hypothetical protein
VLLLSLKNGFGNDAAALEEHCLDNRHALHATGRAKHS